MLSENTQQAALLDIRDNIVFAQSLVSGAPYEAFREIGSFSMPRRAASKSSPRPRGGLVPMSRHVRRISLGEK